MSFLDKTGLTRLWANIVALVSNKQNTLVSGENIKTINGKSILGSGDIEIEGGGSIDTDDFVSKNSPVVKDTFTIEDEGYNNVIRFYPDGQIQIPYHGGGGFDSWYCFAEDEIEDDGGGTIATREWVQANAPSVDTSNFVSKNDTTLKLTDGDSYAGGHLTLSGINGTLVYADYPNAAPCDTIKLDLGAADSGNAYAVNFKFPKQAMAGDYTLATQEWVTANAPSVDTSQFVSKSDTSITINNGEEESSSSYKDITMSSEGLAFTDHVVGNTLKLVGSSGSINDFGKIVTLTLPTSEDGTLATQEWVTANSGGSVVDTSKLVTTNTAQVVTGQKEFTNADLSTENWNNVYQMRFTYQDMFDANGSSALGLRVVAEDWSESGFFRLPELTGEAQTLATQEWVSKNAGGSIDTSKFVQQESERLVLKHDQGDGSNAYTYYNGSGVISYNPCDMAPATTTQLVFQTGWEDVTYSVKVPLEDGTLATREWVLAQIQSQITDTIVNGEW